jgi:O-antigen/teichoic acid export membrane protein
MSDISADSVASAPSNALRNSAANTSRPGFLSNLATLLGGQATCAILGLGLEICYARLLGPSGRGLISLSMMAISLGVLLGGLGGEIPIVVWTADSKKKTSEWLPAVFLWGVIGSLLAGFSWALVYWRWHPPFLRGITSALAIIVLISIPLTIFDGYLTAVLTGLERFRLRAGISVIDQFAALVGIVAFAVLLGRNAEAAMLGILFGLLITLAISFVALRESLQGFWKVWSAQGRFGPALSLGVRAQFANLASFVNYRLDVFIVNYFLNPAQVGLYAVGVVVSEALWQVPQAAAVALTPRTARTIDEGATEFTCFVMRQVLLLSCVSGILLALFAPLLLPLIFGGRFRPSVFVVWWILPGTVAFSLAKVASADFAARAKPEFSALFSLIALVVTVSLDFGLIPRMGIKGAALASSAAYFLNAALLVIALKRQLKVGWKALLVPSVSEFASYHRAWHRCKKWVWSGPTPASAGR